MIYLLIDILFYSFSPFYTSFVLFSFVNKPKKYTYVILYFMIGFVTKNFVWYFIILSLIYVINEYLLKKITKNILIILIVDFLVFFNFNITINHILSFGVMVLFHYCAPYNLMGEEDGL